MENPKLFNITSDVIYHNVNVYNRNLSSKFYSTKNGKSVDSPTNGQDNFYDYFPTLSEINKHLHMTRNLQDASEVLMDMYKSLPESNLVKQYLQKHCLRLLILQGFSIPRRGKGRKFTNRFRKL